jgi:hypothetical protein
MVNDFHATLEAYDIGSFFFTLDRLVGQAHVVRRDTRDFGHFSVHLSS